MLKTILLDVLKQVVASFVKMFSKPHKLTWYDLYVFITISVLVIAIIYL